MTELRVMSTMHLHHCCDFSPKTSRSWEKFVVELMEQLSNSSNRKKMTTQVFSEYLVSITYSTPQHNSTLCLFLPTTKSFAKYLSIITSASSGTLFENFLIFYSFFDNPYSTFVYYVLVYLLTFLYTTDIFISDN